GFFQLQRRHPRMSSRLRMARQRLHSAQRHSVARNPQAAQKGKRRIPPAVEIEREDAARIIALPIANTNLLGVLEKGRVNHALELRTARKPLGDPLRVFALPVQAQPDGLQTWVDHPTLRGDLYIS